MADVKLQAIHYRGAAPALNDVMAGHINLICVSISLLEQPFAAHRLKILAVGSPHRVAQLPDVPTVAESGVPGFEAAAWFGLATTGGTPPEIVRKINADVQKVMNDPAFRAKFMAAADVRVDGGDARAVRRLHQGGIAKLGEDRPRAEHHHSVTMSSRLIGRASAPSRRPKTRMPATCAGRATLLQMKPKASPEAARVGLASLMRPEGPLPDVPFAGLPLRRGPNDAAAILAAKLARWRHGLSSSVLLKLPRSLRAPETMQVSPCSPFRSIPTGLQHVVSWLARTVVTRAFRFRPETFVHSFMLRARALLLRARPDVGPDLADLLVGDHAVPRGHLALAVADDLVEVRLLVGPQQLEVRRRAGRRSAFRHDTGAMFGVHVPAGVGRRLRARRRDPSTAVPTRKSDAQRISMRTRALLAGSSGP